MKRRQFIVLAGGLLATAQSFAQEATKLPRIALVDPAAAPEKMAEGQHPYWGVLLAELRKLGHVEGRTIAVERWSGRGDIEGYAELAKKVTASRPALIVTRTRTLSVRFAAADKRTPIVIVGTISQELRASLARPGGNVTGVYTSGSDEQIYAKQFEFVREITRPKARVAWLGPREVWENPAGEAARKGAQRTGLVLELASVASPVTASAIEAAFAALRPLKFDAVLVSPAGELFPHLGRIAELAIAARLPAIGNTWEATGAGLLLSYGANYEELWRRAASFVDRILKGAKPGDLPIEQPSTIELTLNLKTARALGFRFPHLILQRSDRAVE
jgi:putative ABC transport system substrate-binding protein